MFWFEWNSDETERAKGGKVRLRRAAELVLHPRSFSLQGIEEVRPCPLHFQHTGCLAYLYVCAQKHVSFGGKDSGRQVDTAGDVKSAKLKRRFL